MTAILDHESEPPLPNSAKGSALIKAAKEGKVRLCAIFGGQGNNNLTALSDLRELIQRHGPVITTLIANASKTLSQLSVQSHKSDVQQDFGFSLQAWLSHPESAPSNDHLAVSPISFPLNTLLSLAQYCITCQILGLHPGQLRNLLHAVTGHSQGLLAAMVVSKADSWPSFYQACDEALRISFWTGLESHYATPPCAVSASAAVDCVDNHEGNPSSMLSVSGLRRDQLTSLLERTNSSFGNVNSVHLALINARDKFVVAGPHSSLRSFCVQLRQIKGHDGLDQTRVLAHKRKPIIDVLFLPISAPYHSDYLAGVDTNVCAHMPGSILSRRELGIPVYHTHTGQNLQESESNDLLGIIIRAVTVEAVDWPMTVEVITSAAITHVLDFGPGHVGSLVNEISEGTGLRVIQVTDRRSSTGFSNREELVSTTMPSAPLSWKEQFAPRLLADQQGVTRLETKMTKVFGTPPVMVAGMTPTTVAWDFVIAVMNSGYHIELAGGGYWDERGFENALRSLAEAIHPGRGITCNLLYVNPTTIAWQISVLRRLAIEGVAIDGITIGAGIPSPEKVKEYIESIPGLRHISFKPGSVTAINEVIAIAQQHPRFSIGLQWTGGRAGGHHSWEDFHQPLLSMYGRIRRYPNIVLIVGSGFGGGDDTLPFLTGEWAQSFGYPPMPVDGILLGSRMMVCKEAHTSPQAKDLIIRAQGVDDGEWHKSFDQPTGGVITVESEMGQPIHVLATRGMMLWKEFDQRIFSIKDKAKRLSYLGLHKTEIVNRLNRDFFRPWFAVDGCGRNVELKDMTYANTVRRLCQLMYVHHQNRWIDDSYQTLVKEFIRLAYERLGCVPENPTDARPDDLVHQFEQTLASRAHETIYPEDVSLLLALFRRRGQKPVPFIPQLDEHFITWFKKDSLWQSEDVDAVINQDADRVCVIQGPVAVKHCTTSDESARDILDAICGRHVSLLLEGESKHTRVDAVAKPTTATKSSMVEIGGVGVNMQSDGTISLFEVMKTLDSSELDTVVNKIIHIAGPWAEVCLKDEWIFRGTSRCRNPIKTTFHPVVGDTVQVRRQSDTNPYDEIILTPGLTAANSRSTLKIAHDARTGIIVTLVLPHSIVPKDKSKIEFSLNVQQGPGGCRLYEDPLKHIPRVKALYRHLWVKDSLPTLGKAAGLSSEFTGEDIVLSEKSIYDYINVVRRSSAAQLRSWSPSGLIVPLDYCIVVAWTALTKPLMVPALGCNMLQLLHRSISFRYAPSATPLRVGDTVKAFSRITALTVTSTGKLVKVSADIRRQGERVVMIDTEFFFHGDRGGTDQQFSSVKEPELVVHVDSPVKNALLLSRNWLILDDQSPDLIGKALSFKLTTHTMYDTNGDIALLQVSGVVTAVGQVDTTPAIRLGRVYFEEESCFGNPVTDFLRRHGAPLTDRQQLDNPGWTGVTPIIVHAPANSASYSTVSQDMNPIHVCSIFARYAGLPGTVVHGMHTSAIVRRAVEWALGDTDRTRFRCWQASFEAMVRPNDRLRIEVQHVAVESGRMVLEIQAFHDETGEKVLNGEAEVEQPRTGYVFCGQGSQEKGMGMSLYATRPEVKALWDRADDHLRVHYGFSLLQIVRDNPKTLTVHFGGKRGRHMRDKYLAMTRTVLVPGGGSKEEPILQGLTPHSTSYTFSHPKGLLMSTQFSQPALALMEMAEYAHLEARGVVQTGAQFAGHSLGEYAALGACTSFMAFERLLSLVYYRGLKMQNALPRNPDGRTDYTMVAVDPSRISRDFDEDHFQTLVQVIAEETGLLLETVNYNIRAQQYVCAGHFRPLWILGQLCDDLSTRSHPERLESTILRDLARSFIPGAQLLSNSDSLFRGKATIPLMGIDIPFHSRALRSQTDDYREYLSRNIHVSDIKPEELVARWIPNVVGKPFSLKREYLELVQKVTGSEVLAKLLRQMGG